MSFFIAMIFSKFAWFLMRKIGLGATTLPGRIALFFNKNILKKLSKGTRVILVTGTNGKTTTCRMIEEGLIQGEKSYFSNKSGANLITGITCAFVENSSIFGKCKKDYALIECDENAFKKVSLYIVPFAVVVTNIFRDQLDRFGEVTTTLEAIRKSLKNIKKTNLILNADCSLTYSLSKVNTENKIITFGISENLQNKSNGLQDAVNCIFCQNEYSYDFRTFSHLGGFCCENCGYQRVTPNIEVLKINNELLDGSEVLIKVFSNKSFAKIGLPSTYNIYNALAGIAVLKTCGFADSLAISAVSNAECAFGRMEKFVLKNKSVNIILVKNPAGFSQVISYLSHRKKNYSVAFCLNDNSADGRDVSWIWDVDYSPFFENFEKVQKVYTCGKRCFDMALALDYSSSQSAFGEILEVVENCDYGKLLTIIEKENNDFFIIPSYTSMMDLRPLLAEKFGGKEFWK